MSELNKHEQIALTLAAAIVSNMPPTTVIDETAVEKYYKILTLVRTSEGQGKGLQTPPSSTAFHKT